MSAALDCSHRPPCPGCPRLGDRRPPAAAWRRVEALAAKAGLPPPRFHATPDATGHRHRARLAVRGRARSPKIGLFQADSHRIVDTPRCAVHHPAINAAAMALRDAIRATGVAPYADRPHRGALRYVQIAVERATERVQIVLVGNGPSPEVLGPLPSALAERLGPGLQGLFFNGQPERSNAILGPRTFRLAGQPALRETLGGVDVFFPPAAFGQSHLSLFDVAIARIHGLVPPAQVVAEAHCGVGAIGLGLLARSHELRFNERSEAGLEGLELGLAARPETERARAARLPGATSERLTLFEGADVAIVDPPRRGLEPAVVEALALRPPRRLVYLACGLTALERDLERLTAEGRLRLAGVEAFDFFPYTDHLETLAWLDRRDDPFDDRAAADCP